MVFGIFLRPSIASMIFPQLDLLELTARAKTALYVHQEGRERESQGRRAARRFGIAPADSAFLCIF